MAETVESRLLRVRERIADAAIRAGRSPSEITLVAVSKFHPRSAVLEAIAAGVVHFGENRVQEAQQKFISLDERRSGRIRVDCLGHLQRNKARPAVELFSCVQSIDKTETAAALSTAASMAGVRIDILLELNATREATRHGYPSPESLIAEVGTISALPALRVRGLMTMAPFTNEELPIRRAFSELRETFELAKMRLDPSVATAFDTLSMGMSNDFPHAIAEGSTMVRVGTAIFGERTAE